MLHGLSSIASALNLWLRPYEDCTYNIPHIRYSHYDLSQPPNYSYEVTAKNFLVSGQHSMRDCIKGSDRQTIEETKGSVTSFITVEQ